MLTSLTVVPPPDNAPLSAPAFSFCFSLLNTVLRQAPSGAEDTESMLVRALQIINEHAQLRAEVDTTDTLIDEVSTRGA